MITHATTILSIQSHQYISNISEYIYSHLCFLNIAELPSLTLWECNTFTIHSLLFISFCFLFNENLIELGIMLQLHSFSLQPYLTISVISWNSASIPSKKSSSSSLDGCGYFNRLKRVYT